MKEIDVLLEQATEFHNSKTLEERKVLCISSASTQIQTLRGMKVKIMKNARSQCRDIDIWIKNIAKLLEQNLKEIK